MTLIRSNALLGLSVAFLVAAVVGVQLGQSAISEINPIHFRGELARPVGIDPNAVQPASDAYAGAYGWDQGYAARAADCGGDCDARRARDAVAFAFVEPVPPRTISAPYWRDVTPTAEPRAWAPGEVPNGGLSVERYMHYPIEREDQAAGEQAAADEKPAPEEEPAADEVADE
jgi:hypothetical protein